MTWSGFILRGAFSPGIRAALAIAVVAMNVAAIFLFRTFATGIDISLAREKRFLGADIMVAPKKADFEPEEALMVGAPTGITMNDGILGVLAQIPEIERYSPQLYFHSLKLGCCTMRDYPLVGYDPATDFVILPESGAAAAKPVGENTAVAGCDAARSAGGENVVFFNHPFKIRTALPCTGMALDKTFFLPLDVSRRVAAKQLGIKPHDISSVLIKLKRQDQMDYVVEMIQYLMDDVRAIKVPAMIRKTSERVRLVEKLLGAGLGVLAVSGMALLYGACRLAAETKMREVALMLALGASRGQIMKTEIGEIAVLSIIGAAAGVCTGAAGMFILKTRALADVHAPFVFPDAAGIAAQAAIAIAAALAAALLAALPAALRLMRTEPDTALKHTRR